MALVNLEDDPWLMEYESCKKLHIDIMEQLSQRATYSRSSDKFNQISVSVRLRLKQFNNEVSELYQKLDIATSSSTITAQEAERRVRLVETLHSKSVQMQSMFDDQIVNKYNADREHLLGNSSTSSADFQTQKQSASSMKVEQKRMLEDQEEGLNNLAQIIARQKNIAQTISNEVDYHNEILDDLGTQVDRTDQRVRNETHHISAVDTKDKTCVYWVVIILLFLSIITVVSI